MNFFKPKFWDKNQISILSILFFPASIIIKLLFFFKKNLTNEKRLSIPVICVGNIYLGGTGKTPLCIEIFSILEKLNLNPAFIKKKYIAYQDETNLMEQTGRVYQNKKRIDAIEEAIKNNAKIAILDDGFQDFSVKKDLSIICFNEKQWIGNGLTIPAGPLRESLSSLNRANIAIINGGKNKNIEDKILNENKGIKIFYTKYVPQNISEFKDKKVIAFAGIGNPENFFNLLKENNINIIEEIKFTDHHEYSKEDLSLLIDKSNKNNATLLTTEKDYFRIENNKKENIKYLIIKTRIENEKQFIFEIKKNI